MSGRSEISVGVIGGGVGGLACALSLLQAGFDVHVYERTAALSNVGAGIQVSPNASRVLHGLGLAQELARMGVRPVGFHQRRWDDGRTLLRAPLGDAVVEAFGFPYYQLHGPICSQCSDARCRKIVCISHIAWLRSTIAALASK